MRAIVGLQHGVTRPDALDVLREVGKLRVVVGSRLFHPKVYLFHETHGRAVGWVGSANFTGRGFGYNEEAVLEIPATDQMVMWFEQRWDECGPLEPRVLAAYRKSYEGPKKGWPDERAPRFARIVFKSTGKHGRRYTGVFTLFEPDGSTRECEYRTRQGAVEGVLRELSGDWRNQELLGRIERDGYKIAEKPLVARAPDHVYWSAQHQTQGRDKPRELDGSGWWLSHDTTNHQKFGFIRRAGEIAGVAIVPDKEVNAGF